MGVGVEGKLIENDLAVGSEGNARVVLEHHAGTGAFGE